MSLERRRETIMGKMDKGDDVNTLLTSTWPLISRIVTIKAF